MLKVKEHGSYVNSCVNILALKEALTWNLILALKLSVCHYKGFLQAKTF